MTLVARGRRVDFPRRPLIAGIININDDSFSGDGRIDAAWALGRARELVAEGADIIDVGAESARTNRRPVGEDEELRRLVPFLEGFADAVKVAAPRDDDQIFPPLLSVNTWRSGVAAGALAIAGDILNDMGGLPGPANAEISARTGAALLIMHSVGEPKQKHTHVTHPDILAELERFFVEKLAVARRAGVPDDATILDPGIDFAKQPADNLRILANVEHIAALGRPVLLPVSRKTVIGKVLGLTDPRERDAGTAACIVAGCLGGAGILRVHNVEMAWRTVLSTVRMDPACGAVL